jgi:large subunit ribosomal protein L4
MVQLALRSALSDRASDGKVAVIDRWDFERPKTRDAIAALEALGVGGKVLVVIDRDDELAFRSFRNLPDAQLILAAELNAYDVLCNDWIIFTRATIPTTSAQESAPTLPTTSTAEEVATDGPA